MKTLAPYLPNLETNAPTTAAGRPQAGNLLSTRNTLPYPAATLPLVVRRNGLLMEAAVAEIAKGNIPDLSRVCLDLFHTFLLPDAPYSALQFLPVLKALSRPNLTAINRFMKNPATRHVLVQNDWLKVVLIHWKPGEFSGIHGHPRGGCVFKVLKGKVEEKRYSPDKAQRLLAVSTFQSGSMAYIDDNMAYHAVGNPFGTSAISLHVYTPGKNK